MYRVDVVEHTRLKEPKLMMVNFLHHVMCFVGMAAFASTYFMEYFMVKRESIGNFKTQSSHFTLCHALIFLLQLKIPTSPDDAGSHMDLSSMPSAMVQSRHLAESSSGAGSIGAQSISAIENTVDSSLNAITANSELLEK